MTEILYGIGSSIWRVFEAVWWLVIPIGLWFIFWKVWLYYIFVDRLRRLKWVLLEIRIPENIERTPKAMEQVFASFYQIYSFGLKLLEKYWEGKLTEDFISCEIVGQGGEIKFYIRTLAMYRNLVESALYSQYPEIEIYEAEDYRKNWPRTLPNEIYDIAGTDFQLIKDDVYPIRTWEYFEEAKEEKRLDPIAALAEVMSNLKNDEALWLQIFVRPVDHSWKKKAEPIVDKMLQRKRAKPQSLADKIIVFLKNVVFAPVRPPQWPEEAKKEEFPYVLLSPGEQNILKGIENKIAKIGFETNIRFIYIDKKDSFTPMNVAATMATFNQFNTLDMNGFMPKLRTFTLTPAGFSPLKGFIATNVKWIKRRIIWWRKRQLWDNYMKMRWSSGKKPILNIEELATLFHFPTRAVKAPGIRAAGARKGEPPAGLPTE